MDLIRRYFIILLISLASFTNLASCKQFVLVHGAGHGAWCWYKLIPLLRSSGHNVTALDMAASGINPKQVRDVPFLSDYIAPLTDFMASLPPSEKVILVGHSMGGFVISRAMEKFPDRVSVAVFATAVMPGPRTNFSVFIQEITSLFASTAGLSMGERSYQLSPIQDLTLATLLVRPSPGFSVEDLSKTLRLTNENYGSVSRVFIIASQDQALKKYFTQWMIDEYPPNEVREVTGSDHMIMMSQPNKLFDQLLDISQKYCDDLTTDGFAIIVLYCMLVMVVFVL